MVGPRQKVSTRQPLIGIPKTFGGPPGHHTDVLLTAGKTGDKAQVPLFSSHSINIQPCRPIWKASYSTCKGHV